MVLFTLSLRLPHPFSPPHHHQPCAVVVLSLLFRDTEVETVRGGGVRVGRRLTLEAVWERRADGRGGAGGPRTPPHLLTAPPCHARRAPAVLPLGVTHPPVQTGRPLGHVENRNQPRAGEQSIEALLVGHTEVSLHQRSSSTRGLAPPGVSLHQGSSSTRGLAPPGV